MGDNPRQLRPDQIDDLCGGGTSKSMGLEVHLYNKIPDGIDLDNPGDALLVEKIVEEHGG